MTNKQKILDIIQRLPDEVTVDHAIDELCLLHKIEIGLAQADAGDVMTNEDFKKQLLLRK
jgi:hypothetical protein